LQSTWYLIDGWSTTNYQSSANNSTG